MNNLSLVRWAGGKGKQLNDLLPLIPPGHLYVEPFGGGASILLNRSLSEVEVYNDLDHGLVNLFQVVRDAATFPEFQRRCLLSPYSREIFEEALDWETWDDPVSRAVAFYIMLNQSISGKRLARRGDWSRGKQDNVAERWFKKMDSLSLIHNRIKNVQIECRDALDILEEWDSAKAVFYCDPPYVLDTRTQRKYYAVEPGDDYHERMVDVLLNVKGSVVLSGYDHSVYARLVAAGWVVDGYSATAIMELVKNAGEKKARREIVWRNPRAAESGARRPLFPDYQPEEIDV